MRHAALVVCVIAVPLIASACAQPSLEPLGVVPVEVSIRCVGAAVEASISPYVVEVPEGSQVIWNLTENSNVTGIEINRKKRLAAWPYAGDLPYRGNRENPPKAGNMKSGQVGKRFSYNISGTCVAAGQSRTIVIDPDMIIVRR